MDRVCGKRAGVFAQVHSVPSRAHTPLSDHLLSNHVIYRDLKSSNVMLDALDSASEQCRVARLIDFGTAKHVRSNTTTTIGTPGWMAVRFFQQDQKSLF